MNDEPSCSTSRALAPANCAPAPLTGKQVTLLPRGLLDKLETVAASPRARPLRRAGWRRAGRSWGLQRERGEREAVTPSS